MTNIKLSANKEKTRLTNIEESIDADLKMVDTEGLADIKTLTDAKESVNTEGLTDANGRAEVEGLADSHQPADNKELVDICYNH